MHELKKITKLDDLWRYTESLHKKHFPETTLSPIMAGGKAYNPKFMFVFINPTYRNISSDVGWKGKRRPWTGTKYIWKIFNQAGHFDDDLSEEIQLRQNWDIHFADMVYQHLEEREFYFTNIVKWTGENADLPTVDMTKKFLPILKREIEIVNPAHIVTFGLLPFHALTGEKIKLGEYFNSVMESEKLTQFSFRINQKTFKVIPSYFPVGRGNPKRAIKILSMLP